MLTSTPKYSIVMYVYDLSSEVISQVKGFLTSGIKVYLFTSDMLDDLEADSELQIYREKLFLQWFVVPFREKDLGRTQYFVDGVIDDLDFFTFLTKQAEEQGFYSFNIEQYRAEHMDPRRHLFVMAGAGTGKTTVMINRLLYLKHVLPEFRLNQVAMITFTNEAASIMRRRLNQRLRDYYDLTQDRRYLDWLKEAIQMDIATIHSFAKGLFEREGRELGFSSTIRIQNFLDKRRKLIEKWIDQFAQQDPEVYQKFSKVPHYVLVQAIVRVIQQLENYSLHEDVYRNADYGIEEHHFHKLLQFVIMQSMAELQLVKEEAGAWEVNDLIRKLQEIQQLTDFQLKKQYHTVMVDEFQDTDFIQVKFLTWLVKQSNCRLFVVGDVKQSIYRFRGADYTSFDQLRAELSSHEVLEVYLVKNYRTSKSILEELDSYFRLWGEKVGGFPYEQRDTLQPMRIGDSSDLFEFTQTDLEAEWKNRLRAKEGEDAAILVRSNRDVQWVVEQCEEWGIFCEGQTQGEFYRTQPVRELYLLIRAFLYPLSTTTILALNQSSFGSQSISPYAMVEDYSPDKNHFGAVWKQQPDYPYWEECFGRAQSTPPLILLEQIIQERQPAKRFAQRRWNQWKTKRVDKDPAELRDLVLKQMQQYQNRLEHLLLRLKMEFSDHVASLYMLERYIRIHMSTNTEEDDFPIPEWEKNTIMPIRCMTIHKAKGQEFDHVFLPLLEAPFFVYNRPHIFLRMEDEAPRIAYQLKLKEQKVFNNYYTEYKSSEWQELIAEETRLLYVALTRAKRSLTLAKPKTCKADRPVSWAELMGWRAFAHV